MDHRGSKSVLVDSPFTVKEQRADGRKFVKVLIEVVPFKYLTNLRCAL